MHAGGCANEETPVLYRERHAATTSLEGVFPIFRKRQGEEQLVAMKNLDTSAEWRSVADVPQQRGVVLGGRQIQIAAQLSKRSMKEGYAFAEIAGGVVFEEKHITWKRPNQFTLSKAQHGCTEVLAQQIVDEKFGIARLIGEDRDVDHIPRYCGRDGVRHFFRCRIAQSAESEFEELPAIHYLTSRALRRSV